MFGTNIFSTISSIPDDDDDDDARKEENEDFDIRKQPVHVRACVPEPHAQGGWYMCVMCAIRLTDMTACTWKEKCCNIDTLL